MSEYEKNKREKKEKKEETPKESSEKRASSRKNVNKKNRDLAIIGVLVAVLLVGYAYSSGMLSKWFESNASPTLAPVSEVDVSSSEQFSYAVGAMFADSITMSLEQAVEQGEEIDRVIVTQAVSDILLEKERSLTAEQVEEIITLKQEEAQADWQTQGEENQVAGEAFMEEYRQREGVVETESGVLYTVVESGTGQLVGDQIALVEYEGKLVSGDVFDSSEQNGGEPVPFSATGVIPGLGEILPLMQVGDTWEIVIPSELAYGQQGAGVIIGPGETLVFTVTIVGIEE